MKKLWCLLCLLLSLALAACAVAEPAEDFPDVFAESVEVESEEVTPVEAAPVDDPVEDVFLELGEGEEAPSVDLVAEEEASSVMEYAPERALAAPDVWREAADTGMTPVKLTITKSVTKKVSLGVPYRIAVKGRTITGCASSKRGVATVTDDGLVTLHAMGKAKITVKTGKKKLTLTLEVTAPPTPTNLKATLQNGAYLLSWTAAKHVTGYVVQMSTDGASWTDVSSVGASATAADVTAFVTGPCYFRVFSLLGNVYGNHSDDVSVLGAVRNVRVICEESYLKGPTNRMNVTWDAAAGATSYNVYRATVPSEDYQLIGTTTRTYYPDTRAATKLYAYRVQAVYSGLDMEVALSESATLWTGVQDNVLPPEDETSETGILLLVNKQAQVVTAYIQDANGAYTIPLRHMICSSGRVYDRTKNGSYTLKERRGEWYRYPSGVYIRYPSIYRDGYYFHSPLYNAKKGIMSGTVGKLGTRQSLGCIRLKVNDAEWVYKHCPEGTRVYICDGKKRESLKKAVRPQNIKVKGF